MNVTGNPAWIFMIFLALLVFGAIAAIIWRSWIVGTIVLVLVLLIGGFVFTYGVAQAPSQSLEATVESEIDPEILKTADIYPSLNDAAKYAAVRLYDLIERTQPPLQIKSIRIVSKGKEDVRPIVAHILSERYPNALVVGDDSHPGQAFEMTVNATVESSINGKCIGLSAAQGEHNYQANTCMRQARWFWDVDGYRAENAGGEWIVGSSSRAETSPEFAARQARLDATGKLVPFVIGQFPELGQDQQWVHNRLELELDRGKFIRDTFSQRFTMPVSGQPTYRAGVLVDASSAQLEQLHHSLITEFRHRDSRLHRFGFSLVGMGALICLLYLFLNRATRGYFQMNLRLAATMALVAGVLLILLITGLRLA